MKCLISQLLAEFSSTHILPDKLCFTAEITWFLKHDLVLVMSLVLSLQGH